MKNRLFGKMMLSFGISVLLLLPSAGLANVKAGSLHTPPSLVPVKDEILDKYSQLAAKYNTDCADWDASLPSGEKLKRCLTIVKELRDKYDGFLLRLESITGKIKNGNKWTKELDEDFEKNAAGRGVDAKTVTEVKQEGGFRAFYQKAFNKLKASKSEVDVEIKELERRSQKNAESQFFQNVSYTSSTTGNGAVSLKYGLGILTAVIQIVIASIRGLVP